MTAYMADLKDGQQLHVENAGADTTVTLSSGGASQRQRQARAFRTGQWRRPPSLVEASEGLVLQIEGTDGEFYIRLLGGVVELLPARPTLNHADELPLRQALHDEAPARASIPAMEPMRPMEPMKPMEPMQPMEMRMGTMEMRMGGPAAEPATRYCTQCGRQASAGDRFCARCGNALASAEQ
ncbi:MAG TPA: zinc ribbon domain-containing protein [Armatimonadota bacterium]|nr:zinc ribbon domain-containing protein [Armatimonadota bacterium]